MKKNLSIEMPKILNDSPLSKVGSATSILGMLVVIGIGLWSVVNGIFSGLSWNEFLLLADQPSISKDVVGIGFLLIVVGLYAVLVASFLFSPQTKKGDQ